MAMMPQMPAGAMAPTPGTMPMGQGPAPAPGPDMGQQMPDTGVQVPEMNPVIQAFRTIMIFISGLQEQGHPMAANAGQALNDLLMVLQDMGQGDMGQAPEMPMEQQEPMEQQKPMGQPMGGMEPVSGAPRGARSFSRPQGAVPVM